MRNITKSLVLQQFPQLAHIDTLLFLHHSQLFTWMSYDKSCGTRLIENLFVIFLVFELKMGYHSKTNFGNQVHIWRKEKEKKKKTHLGNILQRWHQGFNKNIPCAFFLLMLLQGFLYFYLTSPHGLSLEMCHFYVSRNNLKT